MKKVNNYIFSVILFLSVSGVVVASQEFTVKDGDMVKVSISKNDITRIAVVGDGKIDNVRGKKKYMSIKEDKKAGEIFITPTHAAYNTEFSFFITDTFGSTYTIVAKTLDVPAQTILLKPSYKPAKAEGRTRYRSEPFIKTVKDLMKSMALKNEQAGYSVSTVNIEVNLWSEAEIHLIRLYKSKRLEGAVYIVSNVSDVEMQLHESEFLGFGDNVVAAALTNLVIKPDASTYLYVVRKTGF